MRIKRPDRKNAASILEAAKRDMEFTLTLQVTEQSSATIIRNIYESFRMIGDALLVRKGVVSEDHIAPIKELLNLKVDVKRPLNLIDNLRRLRHNINYYGYKPKIAEVQDAIILSKALFNPLVNEIKKQIL
jgi:hypothetical protein